MREESPQGFHPLAKKEAKSLLQQGGERVRGFEREKIVHRTLRYKLVEEELFCWKKREGTELGLVCFLHTPGPGDRGPQSSSFKNTCTGENVPSVPWLFSRL